MVGELQAAGDIATGVLAGRAFEPRAGEPISGEHGVHCLNCGAELVGEFCFVCGQAAHVHRTLGSIWHDLLHGVFHFEGKIWHTLPLLIVRPGELTRRYIAGERAKFISPLALFLFSTFLLGAVFSWSGTTFHADGTTAKSTAAGLQQARLDMAKERAGKQVAIVKLDQAIAIAKKAGQPTDALAAKRQDLARDIAVLGGLGTAVTNGVGAAVGDADDDHDLGFSTGFAPFDTALEHIKGNRELALYKLQSNAYKYSWLLIVISAPFVWMLFMFRRRYKMYDHTIFVIYSLSFMSILFVTFGLLNALPGLGWLAGLLIAFGPPVHLYLDLKRAYQLGWFSAAWRTFALLIFASIALTLFAMMIVSLELFH